MAMADQPEFDAFAALLADPATHAGQAPRRIDTHTAAIFLAGDRAFKLRRPVDYGWLDYSTRQRRLAAARREAEQNERTAPGLYLGLAGLLRDGAALRLTRPGDLPDGAEPVTAMRRFPDGALFDRMAAESRLDPELMHRTGRAIAAMHRGAALRPGTGDLPGMARGEDAQLLALGALLGPGTGRPPRRLRRNSPAPPPRHRAPPGAALPWRPAPRQHRALAGRAGALRRHRLQRRLHRHRPALRPRLPADGPRPPRPSRARRPSAERLGRGDGRRPRRRCRDRLCRPFAAAALQGRPRHDPRQGRRACRASTAHDPAPPGASPSARPPSPTGERAGGRAGEGGRRKTRPTRLRAPPTTPTTPTTPVSPRPALISPGRSAISPRRPRPASSPSAALRHRQVDRRPGARRADSAPSSCARTASARACTACPRPSACRPGPIRCAASRPRLWRASLPRRPRARRPSPRHPRRRAPAARGARRRRDAGRPPRPSLRRPLARRSARRPARPRRAREGRRLGRRRRGRALQLGRDPGPIAWTRIAAAARPDEPPLWPSARSASSLRRGRGRETRAWPTGSSSPSPAPSAGTTRSRSGDKGGQWDGVRNYQARNNMKAMQVGDLGFFYHSVDEKRIVGIVEVVAEAHQDTTTDDPRWECVDVRAVAPDAAPGELAEMKADPRFRRLRAASASRASRSCPSAPRSGGRSARWAASRVRADARRSRGPAHGAPRRSRGPARRRGAIFARR